MLLANDCVVALDCERRFAVRVLPVLFVLCLSVMSPASADPVLFHPATGVPNPGQGDSRAMWSEPPDLNGLVGSSEQILSFGLETEIANDFVPREPTITHATWWGGYYNNTTPCQAGIATPGFNLEFFENAGCFPALIIAYISTTDFTEESVGCQFGAYPLFKWGTDVSVDVVSGSPYWFCAQMSDHAFPPQGGRLSTAYITGCVSAYRSAYFGYPDWVPACEFPCYDFSQEFDGDHSEACCFADGHCEFIRTGDCAAHGGVAQGPGSVCDPNPCQATPVRQASWGAVRALFR